MHIATLKNTKASNANLQEYFAKNSISVDPLEYFDTSGKQGWFLSSNAEFNLKQKIESVGKPLKDWDVKILSGVKTGLNEAFIINEEKKNELIANDPKSSEIIKPILRGRDIKKYGYEFAGLYLINSHNGYKKEIPLVEAMPSSPEFSKVIPPIDINHYPAIKEHLDSFEPELSKRQDKGKTQYNLRNCAYVEEFEKEKVIFTKASKDQAFSLDFKKHLLLNTSYLIIGKQTKFICAYLNSKFANYLFLNFYQGGGIEGEITIDAIEKLPIPILDTPEKQAIAGRIEDVVEQILEVKNTTPRPASQSTPQEGNFDTADLEIKIDTLVFDLYELDQNERNLILSSNN
jgi:hypothetical protein